METIARVWHTPNIIPGHNFTVNATTGINGQGQVTGFINHRAKSKDDADKLAEDINRYWNDKKAFPPIDMFPEMTG